MSYYEKIEKKIEDDLLSGRITEGEYKARKDALMKLRKAEEDLIFGRITEEEYKRIKLTYLPIIEGRAGTEVPPPPPTFQKPSIVDEALDLMSKRRKVLEKKSKLKDLLLNKEISEKTFNKIDLELSKEEEEINQRLQEIKHEILLKIKEIEKDLTKAKEEKEEIYARYKIGEVPELEYQAKSSELQTKIDSLEESLKALKQAVKDQG